MLVPTESSSSTAAARSRSSRTACSCPAPAAQCRATLPSCRDIGSHKAVGLRYPCPGLAEEPLGVLGTVTKTPPHSDPLLPNSEQLKGNNSQLLGHFPALCTQHCPQKPGSLRLFSYTSLLCHRGLRKRVPHPHPSACSL